MRNTRPDIRRAVGLLFTLAAVLFIAYLVLDIIAQSVLMLGLWAMPEMGDSAAHHFGQWSILIGSVAVLSFFTLAYVVPLGKRNWRSAGLVQGFIIALFTEMYGFPLTVYVIASLLGKPIGDPGHLDGHLLAQVVGGVVGLGPDTAASAIMVFSSFITAIGFLLILFGWRQIYRARGQIVTDGIYRHVRHPQYTGILIVTLALLIHWPTVVTVLMWPVLLYTYYRLARREERTAEEAFGDEYRTYRQKTPRFLPRLRPGLPTGESAAAWAGHMRREHR
ncbi:MAG: isoprenylcysteine carboxylmethyltransferase family protein [Chloroflexi bacterium]|nr:isoprenylcysteine carboxylmethyltransferase family protein [Chloroflexota bacterium]